MISAAAVPRKTRKMLPAAMPAAEKGWIDEDKIVGEMAVSAFRAGADIYITYYAEKLARMMREGRIG